MMPLTRNSRAVSQERLRDGENDGEIEYDLMQKDRLDRQSKVLKLKLTSQIRMLIKMRLREKKTLRGKLKFILEMKEAMRRVEEEGKVMAGDKARRHEKLTAAQNRLRGSKKRLTETEECAEKERSQTKRKLQYLIVKHIEDQFSKVRFLGAGTFGEVWECVDKTSGMKLACKSILKESLKNPQALLALQREIGIMWSLRGHPGVVQLASVCEDTRHVHILMELCSGGDLFEYIAARGGPLPENEAAGLFRQMAMSVAICHDKGIIHRDLKPENILLAARTSDRCKLAPWTGDICQSRSSSASSNQPQAASQGSVSHVNCRLDGICTNVETYEEEGDVDSSVMSKATDARSSGSHLSLKLADFGMAVQLAPGESAMGHRGSPLYVAPEVLLGQSHGRPADAWSLGVILHILLEGLPPFCGDSDGEVFSRVLGERVRFEGAPWRQVSVHGKDLVRQLLIRDPAARLTVAQALNHPWLLLCGTCPAPWALPSTAWGMPLTNTYTPGATATCCALENRLTGNACVNLTTAGSFASSCQVSSLVSAYHSPSGNYSFDLPSLQSPPASWCPRPPASAI